MPHHPDILVRFPGQTLHTNMLQHLHAKVSCYFDGNRPQTFNYYSSITCILAEKPAKNPRECKTCIPRRRRLPQPNKLARDSPSHPEQNSNGVSISYLLPRELDSWKITLPPLRPPMCMHVSHRAKSLPFNFAGSRPVRRGPRGIARVANVTNHKRVITMMTYS